MSATPPTILFVDDEPNILKSLRRLFMEEDWNLLFATSGAEGLEVLEQEEVDLVVSDFRMPEMDGMAFLAQVRERYPKVVRLFLSGYADKQSVAEAMALGCAQQIVSKPWEEQELRQVLEKCLRQSRAQRDKSPDLQTLINNIPALPTLPAVFLELRQALANREAVNLDAVAEIVGRDVSMSSTLLRWANSALFGQRSRVETVKRALVVLGTDIVEGLLLSKSVHDTLQPPAVPGFDLEAFQTHSLGCAVLARELARRQPEATVEYIARAFTAGMLHDLGKLVEAQFFTEPFTRAVAEARQQGGLLLEAEKEAIGYDHAEFGGYLAAWWNLPPFLVMSARWHHDPDKSTTERHIVSLVHVANALVQDFGVGQSGNLRPPEIDKERWQRFDLTPELLEELQEKVRDLSGFSFD